MGQIRGRRTPGGNEMRSLSMPERYNNKRRISEDEKKLTP